MRPFWGRATVYFAGLLVALYLIGTAGVYIALRVAKYDLNYATIAWPPHWTKLRNAQENLYAARAQAALDAGRFSEAILALEKVCELNPQNYPAALTLARLTQVAAQPTISDQVYERLLADAPDKRVQTAQLWFRALLARSAYHKIIPLAATMIGEDPESRAVWLHALLFSARQTRDSRALNVVLQQNPHYPEWCTEIITIEIALIQKHDAEVIHRLTQLHRYPASPYLPHYQVDRLLLHGRADDARKTLETYSANIPAHEAGFLRMRMPRTQNTTQSLDSEFDALLKLPMSPALSAKFCAYLMANPSPAKMHRYFEVLSTRGPALTEDSLAVYNAAFVTAAVCGDAVTRDTLRAKLRVMTSSDGRVLDGLTTLILGKNADDRLHRVLPLVPLPTEVIYAILEKFASATELK